MGNSGGREALSRVFGCVRLFGGIVVYQVDAYGNFGFVWGMDYFSSKSLARETVLRSEFGHYATTLYILDYNPLMKQFNKAYSEKP